MIGQPSCCQRRHPVKSRLMHVEFRNESVNYPNRIVLAYAVVPAPWSKWVLLTVLALHKACHPYYPPKPCRKDSKSSAVGVSVFSHSLESKRTFMSTSRRRQYPLCQFTLPIQDAIRLAVS